MRSNAHVDAALIDAANESAARRCQDQAHAGCSHDFFLNLEHRVVHCGEVRTLRCVHVNIKFGFIDVAGDVFLLHDLVKRNVGNDND